MNASPAPTVSFTSTCGAGAVVRLAAVPKRGALFGARYANAVDAGCFRQRLTIARDRRIIARRVRDRFAGANPMGELSDFAVIQL